MAFRANHEAAPGLAVKTIAVWKPALETMVLIADQRIFDHDSGSQQRIELARLLKGMQIVAAADMGLADENLRHAGAAPGALRHQRLAGAVAIDRNLRENRFFPSQQVEGRVAIGAAVFGIDGDGWHETSRR